MSELTRPIIGIENRTPREVFDIMCDRFTALLKNAVEEDRYFFLKAKAAEERAIAAETRLAEARAEALELTEWERNELWLYADAGASFETYGPDERSKWKQLSDKLRALKSGGAK